MDYEILTAMDIGDLEAMVKDRLAHGYQLHGGVAAIWHRSDKCQWLFQAVAKNR